MYKNILEYSKDLYAKEITRKDKITSNINVIFSATMLFLGLSFSIFGSLKETSQTGYSLNTTQSIFLIIAAASLFNAFVFILLTNWGVEYEYVEHPYQVIEGILKKNELLKIVEFHEKNNRKITMDDACNYWLINCYDAGLKSLQKACHKLNHYGLVVSISAVSLFICIIVFLGATI